jgi:hypothetical protein
MVRFWGGTPGGICFNEAFRASERKADLYAAYLEKEKGPEAG